MKLKDYALLLFGVVAYAAGAWVLAVLFPRYLLLGIWLGLIAGGWLVAPSADEQKTTQDTLRAAGVRLRDEPHAKIFGGLFVLFLLGTALSFLIR